MYVHAPAFVSGHRRIYIIFIRTQIFSSGATLIYSNERIKRVLPVEWSPAQKTGDGCCASPALFILTLSLAARCCVLLYPSTQYLDKEDSDKPIYLYVNCPGGSVIAGLALYDTMQHVNSQVVTINVGMAASMASFILAAGTKVRQG